MKIIKVLGFVILILFGVFVFVYGGYDDSPGAQLLGVIIVVIGIWRIIKSRKKVPKSNA
jgi:cadmium resistance protein CadD (predicted permease)